MDLKQDNNSEETLFSLTEKGLEKQLTTNGQTTLIIGLDFGTTYSGVAYAFTNKPNAIYTIEDWPGAGGRTYSKCPTLIEYTSEYEFKWGFDADRSSDSCIEGIKLLLDPDQPKPIYAPSIHASNELERLNKTPKQVAADYIRAIYEHAIQIIESKAPKGYLKMVPKQFVLSVPAVWSDKAQDATLRAAQVAGITPVTLIKEPEAAALFTMHALGRTNLKEDDALILCDAGGGTVDLIGYEIKSMKPFELTELTIATGGLAGSLLVNKRFEEWVEQVVGDSSYAELRKTEVYKLAMKHFDESVKPAFRSKNDRPQYVVFPGADLEDNLEKGLKRDAISVTGESLFAIFDPICREINRLVTEQLNDARLRRFDKEKFDNEDVKAVFLVGGFGASKYVFDQLTQANPDVQIIQPNDAWSAIVRGAVLSQLPSQARVVTNVAPKHYGVDTDYTYDEVKDAGKQRHWCNEEDRWLCTRIHYFIKKGEDLERSRKIEHTFYRRFPSNPKKDELQVVETLKECSLDTRPVHPQQGVTKPNCKINVDLSTVPERLFRKKSRISSVDESLVTWWELYYTLKITIQSGPMVFSTHVDGKQYGQAKVEY